MSWLTALPALISLLKEIVDLIKKLTEKDPRDFLKESHEVVKQVKDAKTIEEKQKAAQALASLINRL